MDSLELSEVEFLVDDANLEVNRAGGRQIDSDLINIEPEQEPLHLDSLQVGDGTVTNLASDGLLVVDRVIKVNITGVRQRNDEPSIIVERVVDDGVREETRREAELGEDIVDCLILVRRERRRGTDEREKNTNEEENSKLGGRRHDLI